jgi:hypothetical protein
MRGLIYLFEGRLLAETAYKREFVRNSWAGRPFPFLRKLNSGQSEVPIFSWLEIPAFLRSLGRSRTFATIAL